MNNFEKIRIIGIVKTIKIIKDRCLRPLIPIYYSKRWNHIYRIAGYKGITNIKREEPVIISLTTYPARINEVHYAVETLLAQTLKPDMVILWLADEQFPDRDLPENLTCLQQYGLTISWCNDIRSYKKLIPTLKKYPEAVIITADDDMYYHPKMVERLYKAYLEQPEYIHCHRVTKIIVKEGVYSAIPGGYDVYAQPSYLHKLTGCSGALYPPASLYRDISNEELFMHLAPTNDDIWFWLMSTLNGRRCNIVKHSCTALNFVKGSQKESLQAINDNGERLFWKQFQNILEYYPEVDRILREEWKREIMK